jgi:hypothetical protein
MRDCGTRTCASLIDVDPAYRRAHAGYALLSEMSFRASSAGPPGSNGAQLERDFVFNEADTGKTRRGKLQV